MTLATGTSLGPYRILAPVGAGGMGEVYRARDTRLGRDVAIKVIPAELARDPERIKRFEQEARAAGALNHPNVCAIYDLGTHDGSPFVVMELLEGESLRARLDVGPIPARKAIDYAAQAAHGLAAAYEKGIVHRDLKPENLFLTRDGRVKVLDFGLAKLTRPDVLAPAGEKPISIAATETGAILGTVGYMAPEQVRGQPADARSDLFALGAILYELVTGNRAFHGASYVETLHAILNEEPAPLSGSGRDILPGLEPIVRRCLEKEPAERFQSASDLAFALGAIGGTPDAPARTVRAHSPARERAAWALAVIATIVAVAALLAPRWLLRPVVPRIVRFSITAPSGGTLVNDNASAVLSPDGRLLALVVQDSLGTPRLWVRPLDSFVTEPIAGTEGAVLPFWSPDSRAIAFFAEGKLKKVPVVGGRPEVICPATSGRGGTWSHRGMIVFAPMGLGGLMRVPAEGGEPAEVVRPDSSRHETGLRFPCFLPDGRHFLYVSLPGNQARFSVYVGDVESGEHHRIMAAGGAPVYAAPGYLVFLSGDRIVAQRFDRSSLRPTGVVVALGPAPLEAQYEGSPVVSAAGGMIAHTASEIPVTRLIWLDRSGRTVGTVPLSPGNYSNLSLSPDDCQAAVTRSESHGSTDLWLVDLQRSVTTRLTFDGKVAASGGVGAAAIWSRDGRRLAYDRDNRGIYDVFVVSTAGGSPPEPLFESNRIFKLPASWSPDGRTFVVSQNEENGQQDLWLVPTDGHGQPTPYLRTPFNENTAAISPDGHWLAYDSDETGTEQIYVRPFPAAGEKDRIPIGNGSGAQWSRDGKELLIWTSGRFSANFGPVYAVSVQTSPVFKAGPPRLLFTPRADLLGLAATSDLKRFLAAEPVEGVASSITIIVNWQQAPEADRSAP